MKKVRNNNLSEIKKQVVRTVLERVQGDSLKYSMGSQDFDFVKDDSIIEILDNAYVNRNGVPLAMDIFKPNVNEDVELPVIVVVHGGGLVMGDRKMSRYYAFELAKRGYLVFTIEYRLAPRANVCDQLDDVCAGLDMIGKKLVDFNVDFTRMYLTADSAGAYLSIYVSAMKKSLALQEAIGHEPSKMIFKGLGLLSGMFYTNKKDLIGAMLSDQFYGDKAIDENFLKYMDPENKEILDNLPPVFLVTSKGDFLNKYTLDFHEALKKNGNLSHLQYYGSDELGHAFPAIRPDLKESQDAIDKMVKFFSSKKILSFEKNKMTRSEKANYKKLQERIKSGEIVNQTAAAFIKEMNSYSKAALDTFAIEAGYKEYTYREMFERWDKYARAFSYAGIEEGKSRVGIIASKSESAITALYALNMMGVSVVALPANFLVNVEKSIESIKAEGITDFIIFNDSVIPGITDSFNKILKQVDVNNVIVAKSKFGKDYLNPVTSLMLDKNYVDILDIEGAVRMKSLLDKSEDIPVKYATRYDDESAFVVHTTGTSKGIPKPVPLSNVAVNSAAISLLSHKLFKQLKNRPKTTLVMPYFAVYSLVNQIHLPFAASGELQIVPQLCANMYSESTKFGANIIFASDMIPMVVGAETKNGRKVDFSKAEMIIFGGAYLSPERKKQLDDYFASLGSKVKVLVGYGLSEASGACIISDPEDYSDSIGYPIPGTKVKIQDEEDGKFYDSTDGVHRGGMFISSSSISSGKLNGVTFFELDEIDGEKYYNTYDAVESDGNGKLRFIGRTNRYFVNNEGIRFDQSLIETSLQKEKGVKACVLAPRYSKIIHDTVPVLYIEHELQGEEALKAVKESMNRIFVEQNAFEKTNLPAQIVFVDAFPYTRNGKIDIRAVQGSEIEGNRYSVFPKKENGKLVEVVVEVMTTAGQTFETLAIPEELEATFGDGEGFANLVKMIEMILKIDSFFKPKPKEKKDTMPQIDTSKVLDLLKVFFKAVDTDINYED